VQKEGIATDDHDHDRREAALRLQEWFNLARTSLKKSSRRGYKRKASAPMPPAKEDASACESKRPSEAPEQAREREEATPINPPLTFALQHLDAGHPYLKARGLADETIKTFGLGYFAGKGSMHGRIVIPVHNEHGELVAYAGRFPGDPPEGEPKYKLPANFHKSLLLYNFHRAREHGSEGLIVVEGFFPVFELWQKGRRNVVAVMGNHLSKEQEALIVATVGPKGRALIAFDDDEAGREGAANAATRLVSQIFVRTIALA
jgi:DNA primase